MLRTPYGLLIRQGFLYLLHPAHSHLDDGGGTVRVLSLDFLSAFNTIQSLMVQDKVTRMRVDACLVSWISSYLIDTPQNVRLKDVTSETGQQHRNTSGDCAGPSSLHSIHHPLCYNSELCLIQRFADDSAIMGCIRDDREEEYMRPVKDCLVPY